jgi:hypothetical protein
MFMLNQQLLDQLKTEIANEMGIELSADTSAKLNGAVGGEVTKRLIQLGEMKLQEIYEEQQTQSVQSIPPYQMNQTYNQNQLH